MRLRAIPSRLSGASKVKPPVRVIVPLLFLAASTVLSPGVFACADPPPETVMTVMLTAGAKVPGTALTLIFDPWTSIASGTGQFCSCAFRFPTDKIASIDAVRLVETGTNNVLASFDTWTEDLDTSASVEAMLAAGAGEDWTGFLSSLNATVEPGVEADFQVDITLASGITIRDLGEDLAADLQSMVFSDEADSIGIPMGTHGGFVDIAPRQPYLVYDVPHLFDATDLEVQDQFGTAKRTVDRCDFFMNPVQKTHVSPPGVTDLILNPALHYTWNRFTEVLPTGLITVSVTDQFGASKWTVSDAPTYLLAPTSKCTPEGCIPDPVPDEQHYQCYQVVNGPDPNQTVDLWDQFGDTDGAEVGAARWLCNPTQKTVLDLNTGLPIGPPFIIQDAQAHLACYNLPLRTKTFSFTARDQFPSPFDGSDGDELFLCVDAVKQPLPIPTLSEWGIIGLFCLLLTAWMVLAYRRRGAMAT